MVNTKHCARVCVRLSHPPPMHAPAHKHTRQHYDEHAYGTDWLHIASSCPHPDTRVCIETNGVESPVLTHAASPTHPPSHKYKHTHTHTQFITTTISTHCVQPTQTHPHTPLKCTCDTMRGHFGPHSVNKRSGAHAPPCAHTYIHMLAHMQGQHTRRRHDATKSVVWSRESSRVKFVKGQMQCL